MIFRNEEDYRNKKNFIESKYNYFPSPFNNLPLDDFVEVGNSLLGVYDEAIFEELVYRFLWEKCPILKKSPKIKIRSSFMTQKDYILFYDHDTSKSKIKVTIIFWKTKKDKDVLKKELKEFRDTSVGYEKTARHFLRKEAYEDLYKKDADSYNYYTIKLTGFSGGEMNNNYYAIEKGSLGIVLDFDAIKITSPLDKVAEK